MIEGLGEVRLVTTLIENYSYLVLESEEGYQKMGPLTDEQIEAWHIFAEAFLE